MIGGELNHALRSVEDSLIMSAIQVEIEYRRGATSHSMPVREAITAKVLPLLREARDNVEAAWKEVAAGYGDYAIQYTRS